VVVVQDIDMVTTDSVRKLHIVFIDDNAIDDVDVIQWPWRVVTTFLHTAFKKFGINKNVSNKYKFVYSFCEGSRVLEVKMKEEKYLYALCNDNNCMQVTPRQQCPQCSRSKYRHVLYR